MRINNSYYMFNFLWTAIGGTDLIACKTPTNVISSVSLQEHIYFNETFVSGNAKFQIIIKYPFTANSNNIICLECRV